MNKSKPSSEIEGASAQVVTALRAAVNNKLLLPGEHIRQDYWAEKLGVSRIPIREALKILTYQGFLDHIPHRGYFLQKISTDQLRQIHRLRQLIETEISATLRWPSKEELGELEVLAKRTVKRFVSGDYLGAYDDDRTLNQMLWDLSPNDFYAKEARRLIALCEVNRLQAGVFKNQTESRYKAHYQELVIALATHNRESLINLEHAKHETVIKALEQSSQTLP